MLCDSLPPPRLSAPPLHPCKTYRVDITHSIGRTTCRTGRTGSVRNLMFDAAHPHLPRPLLLRRPFPLPLLWKDTGSSATQHAYHGYKEHGVFFFSFSMTTWGFSSLEQPPNIGISQSACGMYRRVCSLQMCIVLLETCIASLGICGVRESKAVSYESKSAWYKTTTFLPYKTCIYHT